MITKHYQDPGGRWAITVPITWVPLADAGTEAGDAAFVILAAGTVLKTAMSMLDKTDEPDIDALLVGAMPGVTLAQAVELWRGATEPAAITAVTEQPCALAGRPAQQVVIDATTEGVAHRTRFIGVAAGGGVYSVIHSAPLARYLTQEPTVSAALASFELLPAADLPPAPTAQPGAKPQFSEEGRRLLRVDRHGVPAMETDEGDERDRKRIPGLQELLQDGSARDQFYACKLLVSWGDPDGYETLVAWAHDPAAVPWVDSRIAEFAEDRTLSWTQMLRMASWIRGPDREPPAWLFDPHPMGFDGLASAVVDSNDSHRQAPELRLGAQRALLAITGDYEVGAGNALSYDANLAALRADLTAAVDKCLRLIEAQAHRSFDLRGEVSALIGALARVDDDAAASGARRFITTCADPHPLALLAIALGHLPEAPQIRAVLTELSAHPDAGVADYARGSLASMHEPGPAASAASPNRTRRWVAGYLLALIAAPLVILGLVQRAEHDRAFARGGTPAIMTSICGSGGPTECFGSVYDSGSHRYLGNGSFRTFAGAGDRAVVRVLVGHPRDRDRLAVRPDSRGDAVVYWILISTCAAAELLVAAGLVGELRRSTRRRLVGWLAFGCVVVGVTVASFGSYVLHLPTAASSAAPVIDPVVSSDGALDPDLRVFPSAQAHYYRLVGHTPDSAQACGQLSGCAHGVAITMVDSAGDLVAAGWRLRLTGRGSIDDAIRAVRDGDHPVLQSVPAAAVRPYPVPPSKSADVVDLPGPREGGTAGSGHEPFQAGADIEWSARQAVGVTSAQGDEIIVLALTRTDGGALTHGAREQAVLRDLAIILQSGRK